MIEHLSEMVSTYGWFGALLIGIAAAWLPGAGSFLAVPASIAVLPGRPVEAGLLAGIGITLGSYLEYLLFYWLRRFPKIDQLITRHPLLARTSAKITNMHTGALTLFYMFPLNPTMISNIALGLSGLNQTKALVILTIGLIVQCVALATVGDTILIGFKSHPWTVTGLTVGVLAAYQLLKHLDPHLRAKVGTVAAKPNPRRSSVSATE